MDIYVKKLSKKYCKNKKDSNIYLTKDKIEVVYYLHVEGIEEDSFEEKYFLCIGKTNSSQFFAYKATACGTGFGFCETSYLYFL
jgi:hypothetical protein